MAFYTVKLFLKMRVDCTSAFQSVCHLLSTLHSSWCFSLVVSIQLFLHTDGLYLFMPIIPPTDFWSMNIKIWSNRRGWKYLVSTLSLAKAEVKSTWDTWGAAGKRAGSHTERGPGGQAQWGLGAVPCRLKQPQCRSSGPWPCWLQPKRGGCISNLTEPCWKTTRNQPCWKATGNLYLWLISVELVPDVKVYLLPAFPSWHRISGRC